MSCCPITFKECPGRYSREGVRLLSPRLTDLKDFPYSAEQQRQEAVLRAGKISIQGIQPKLSVVLNVTQQTFTLSDQRARYIIKPQHATYPNLPENEALTMRLAQAAGIEVPVHGLVYAQDGSLSYFVRRFDRIGYNKKLALEDFAQLSRRTRDTKYDASMEQLASVLDRYCTFPALEKVKLLQRCLFNFLAGNEDMHLKNFSLITRNGKVELSPAYDLLNTTVAFLALGKALGDIEEVALPLRGRKKGLTASGWLRYYARERLELNDKVIEGILNRFRHVLTSWNETIEQSFLPDKQKLLYRNLLNERCTRLGLGYDLTQEHLP
jgi:serine/threonine-protein kinase HipA